MRIVAIDTEFTEKGEVILFQYRFEGEEPKYIYKPKKEEVAEILKGNHVIGYNMVVDIAKFFTGKEFKDLVGDYDDLYLMAKVKLYRRWLASEINKKGVWSLDAVLKEFGVELKHDKKTMQKVFSKGHLLTKDMLEYALEDVKHLHLLYDNLKDVKNNTVYKLDKAMIPVVVDVMKAGLPINRDKAMQYIIEIEQKLEDLNNIFVKLDLNPNSPIQVKDFLKTPDAQELTLRKYIYFGGEKSNIAQAILDFKKLNRLYTMIRTYMSYGDRVYGNFDITQAMGGRMSSYKENLQQIPRQLRKIFGFKEDDGRFIVKVDFPAIELRLACIIVREPIMIKLFNEGVDLHTYTAQQVYGKEEITKEERQIAKGLNFGLLYGMSHKTLQDYILANTGIALHESQAMEFRYKWFKTYQGIEKWHKDTKKVLDVFGIYEGKTLLGRKYITSKFTIALNQVIQGSGAELLKLVAYNSWREGVKIINLVHDEIVAEAESEEEAKEFVRIIQEKTVKAWEKLCDLAGVKIPIPVEGGYAKSWGDFE